MSNLTSIEGIGPTYAEKLKSVGISTTETLLEKGATPKSRREIADKSGISEKAILRWVNMADLFRVKGVGEEFADLLEAAGVDTVPELSHRNVDNLFEKMMTVNEERHLVRQVPARDAIASWVEQAKTMPRKVTY